MSEVYIRSQNREKLYRLGGNYACLEEIGVYATKERCLEVMDELQKVCGAYLHITGGMGYAKGSPAYTPPIVAVIPRIYEMPQE